MGTKDAVNLLRSPGFAALCHRHGVSLAVLFGSQAGGRATDASDIDLTVLMEDKGYARDLLCLARERRQFMKDLITYLQTAHVDLVILNHANPLLRFRVAKNGKPVCEGMPGLFAQFCSLAVRQREGRRFSTRLRTAVSSRLLKRGYLVDPLVVKRKLQKMLEYLNELESIRDITLEDYVKDFRNVPSQLSHRVPDVRTSLLL